MPYVFQQTNERSWLIREMLELLIAGYYLKTMR